ncbi:hypothetical protein ACQB60_08935 [Actinomycetota bacterium Odt1-20B]
MRTTTAVLATAAAITGTQLGLAEAASAAPRKAAAAGCPVDISYPTRFYTDHNGWVTNGGLYFGIKNRSSKSFKKVSFTVTNKKNIRFGKATPHGGGKITHRTSQKATVYKTTLKGKKSLGFKVRTHVLNRRSYKVSFTLHGQGRTWNCAVKQGGWGV